MKLQIVGLLLACSALGEKGGDSARSDIQHQCPVSYQSQASDNTCSFNKEDDLGPPAPTEELSHDEPQSSDLPVKEGQFAAAFDGQIKRTESIVSVGPRRWARSGQQALEFLVSNWNDLTSWPERNINSSVCQLHAERAIRGYLSDEMWALQMFDAWAKPGPSLLEGRSLFVGNYYQCREARFSGEDGQDGFSGNYCAVTLSNLSYTINTTDLYQISALSKVQLGTCFPDTCQSGEVTRLVQEKLDALNISSFFQVRETDCRTDEREYTVYTKLAILIVVCIGTLTVLGTSLDLATANQPPLPRGLFLQALLSFSAYTNGRRLLSTSEGPGAVSVISGIRVLSMINIVIAHVNNFIVFSYSSNSIRAMDVMYKYRVMDVYHTVHFSVDSFFTISGFLVSYQTVKQIIDQGWRFHWKRFYIHRYLRLIVPFFVALILIQGLQRFMVHGAFSPTKQPSDKVECEKYWWHLVLFLNNYLGWNTGELCNPPAWSNAVEYQFHIISPLMLLPFYYHRSAGVITCLLFAVASSIFLGMMSYQTEGAIEEFRTNTFEWLKHSYLPSTVRIAPFALGILAGYLLSVKEGRVKMSGHVVAIGWIVATTAALVLVFGFHGDMTRESPSSLTVATVYNAASRGVWGACVCWVIVACTSGYGGPITSFLSWPPFIVMARVTYFGYLTHGSIIPVVMENMQEPVFYNFCTLAVFATSCIVFTCVVSAVLVICVQMPMFNLEKVCSRNPKP